MQLSLSGATFLRFILIYHYTGVRGAATHHAGITQVLQNTTAMSALITTTDGEY